MDETHYEQIVLAAIKNLLTPLSQEARKRVLIGISDHLVPNSRYGAVLLEVVKLLPRQATWTTKQLVQAMKDNGSQASRKAIYNALTYLKRRGDLRHEGYGRYSYHLSPSKDKLTDFCSGL